MVSTVGVGTDRSLTAGVGAFGYEGHVGVNITEGLGVTAGGSHTDEKGNITGGDLKVSAGLVTALALVTDGAGALLYLKTAK